MSFVFAMFREMLMFRKCSETEFDELSEGGTRYLFQLDNFDFRDTLDGEGYLHFVVVEESDGDPTFYEADQEVMYEFMARYLAGEYEKIHYEMELSPTHAALLDVMEMASARARSGDPSFTFDQVVEDQDEIGEVEEVDGSEEEWRDDSEN